MLVALTLLSCSLFDDPETIDVDETPPPAGGAMIATAPSRAALVRADVIAAPLPGGEPILNDCFSRTRREASMTRPSRKPRAVQQVSPAPPPVASPSSARPIESNDGFGRSAGGPVPGDLQQPASPKQKNEEQASRPRSEPTATEGSGGGPLGDKGVIGGVASAPPAFAGPAAFDDAKTGGQTASPAGVELGATLETDAPSMEEVIVADRDSAPLANAEHLDWGATVYLSNDDSMSLASAQRMLYALTRGVQLKPSEIRPHELLNYFSFDTVPPAEGRTFGVLGAAEQDGDTLTVSLAVRGANPARQPLDLTVLLDRSCSMAEEGRMAYTQRGLRLLSDNLQRGDRIDVVLFDSGVCTAVENFVVGRDSPSILSDVIEQLAPTSATNLDAGLKEAFRIQTGREKGDVHGRSRRVLLVTDAVLNTGNLDEAMVAEVGRQLDANDIHLSGIGVGRDFNDAMLDRLTERGRGAYVYLGSEAVVDRVFGPGFDALVRTVAHDVQFSLDLPDSLAMRRFYGEEASTDKADIDPIHYHAGTTQLFLQDLAIKDRRVVRNDPISLRIEYRNAKTMEPVVEELRTTVGALLDGDPHNLRKGKALMAFTDFVMADAMGDDPCGSSLNAYRDLAGRAADDAEVAFVNGLMGSRCGVNLTTVVNQGVAVKLKLDSDVPIAEVSLQCGTRSHEESLRGSDTVARFTGVTPGACTVRLGGTVPMAVAVDVPSVGGDLRCQVRAGRISCS